MAKNFIQVIPRTQFNSAALQPAPAYAAINAGGLPNACSMLRIVNDSTVDIDISFNGAIDHDFLRSGESLLLMNQTLSKPTNNVALFKQGTVVYVAGAAPGVGNIYLSGYYQE